MAFCDALEQASGPSGAVATLDIDDAAAVDAAIAELSELRDLAPTEISTEVGVIADVYGEVLTSIAATAEGARAEVLRELQARLDEAAAPAAALDRYARARCSIDFEAPAVPTPTPTPLSIDD